MTYSIGMKNLNYSLFTFHYSLITNKVASVANYLI